MSVVDILKEIKEARGTNAKKSILAEHADNKTLLDVLRYGLDTFMPFNIVKVPKTILRAIPPGGSEEYRFDCFFSVADCCASRTVTGNSAVNTLSGIFSSSTEEEEFWMRKILKKNLTIGISTKSVNKIFPGLIQSFSSAEISHEKN